MAITASFDVCNTSFKLLTLLGRTVIATFKRLFIALVSISIILCSSVVTFAAETSEPVMGILWIFAANDGGSSS